ncbi:MAG TPA: hypothetical protein PLK87_17970, partial [Verrucomicrobiota bacterium]|nr:hypothetical protein [Verrucomicrobiota bacterium]
RAAGSNPAPPTIRKNDTTMNDFSQYSIRVGTDAGYYGSQCTDADALRIAGDVANLIENEFPGINVTTGETSKSVTGPDEATCEEIRVWVESHWTAAL